MKDITELDMHQIWRMAFHEAARAIKVELASNTSMNLQMSASSDSISTVGMSSSTKASASTGIAPMSCVGMKQVCIYADAPCNAQVQVSPSDTDNVWFDVCALVNTGSPASAQIVARRIQVASSGTANLYLVVQG